MLTHHATSASERSFIKRPVLPDETIVPPLVMVPVSILGAEPVRVMTPLVPTINAVMEPICPPDQSIAPCSVRPAVTVSPPPEKLNCP